MNSDELHIAPRTHARPSILESGARRPAIDRDVGHDALDGHTSLLASSHSRADLNRPAILRTRQDCHHELCGHPHVLTAREQALRPQTPQDQVLRIGLVRAVCAEMHAAVLGDPWQSERMGSKRKPDLWSNSQVEWVPSVTSGHPPL